MMNLKQFSLESFDSIPAITSLRSHFSTHDPSIFPSPDFFLTSYSQKFQTITSNFIKLYTHLSTHFPSQLPDAILHLDSITPMGPHFLSFNGFYPPLKLLAAEDQLPTWEKLILEGRLIGAYAQTEIGHGSDVQSLMTTATYNKEKDCFVMDSPGIKATKYWVGVLGMHATHAVLQAKMFVEGKSYGLQTFVVPIRDPKTYQVYDGVDCGDIGGKLGLGIMDNGYLRMKHYEIPRDNLLMKFIKVDKEGNVKVSGDKNAVKIGYGGMLGLRVWLIKHFVRDGYKSLVIRYRGSKKQGEISAYERRKLLKEFAYVYSGILTVDRTTKMHRNLLENIKKNLKAALEELDELHLIAAGFKPIYAWGAVRQTRSYSVQQSLGSLMAAGTIGSYGDKVPGPTYEGDNLVLLQQVARGLMKYMEMIEKGKGNKIPNSFRFLADLSKETGGRSQGLEDLKGIEEILDRIIYENVKENYEKMKRMIMKGETGNKVWNERLQGEMIRMGLRASEVLTWKMANKEILSEEMRLKQRDLEILKDMVRIYGLGLLGKEAELACVYKIGNYEEIVKEEEEKVMKRLEGELEYIGESVPFGEEELCYLRDYRQWSEKAKDGMEMRLKEVAVRMKGLSKL